MLQKPDGSKTVNMTETLKFMMEQLIPEDNVQDDTDHHKNVRKLTEQPIKTTDDKEFTQGKVRQIEVFKPRKAPGPDGITSEILQLVYKSILKTLTSIHNECLRSGCFPKNWKIVKIVPIARTRQRRWA